MILICIFPLIGFSQQERIIHKPQTTVIIPGLRREFTATLAMIKIAVNPGWRAEEIENDSDHIYQLLFTDPEDSSKTFLTLTAENFHSNGFDSVKWENLKKSIRISYGDRGIAVRPLADKITEQAVRDSTGILASYEILTRHPDFIEYVDAFVGKTSLLLLSAHIKTEEYRQNIDYFRDIAESVRLQQNK